MISHDTHDGSDSRPWYRRWFGESYLRLYPHRDEDEAERGVDLLAREGGISAGDRVLDLACGGGRHMRAMRRHGIEAIGLDLSSTLLDYAQSRTPGACLVRADMRHLPFRSGSFRAVSSFFTSFGYFASDEDDGRVMSEVRRVLRGDGIFLLDFLNAARVRAELSPRSESEIDGQLVVQERRLVDDGRVVEKTISISPEGGEGVENGEVFRERVRLYASDDIEALLSRHELSASAWFGDYGGGPHSETAPRAIVLARPWTGTRSRKNDPSKDDDT